MNVQQHKPDASEYVIQRSSETVCEWWTGTRWTENWDEAMFYAREPDASVETGCESAKTKRVSEANVTSEEVLPG